MAQGIQTCSAPQNDRLNLSFVKDNNLGGKKMDRNDQSLFHIPKAYFNYTYQNLNST